MKILRNGPPQSSTYFIVCCKQCKSLLLLDEKELIETCPNPHLLCDERYSFTCGVCHTEHKELMIYNGETFIKLGANTALLYSLLNVT